MSFFCCLSTPTFEVSAPLFQECCQPVHQYQLWQRDARKNAVYKCATTLMLYDTLCSQKSKELLWKKVFEKVIVNLPTEQTRTIPGLELVVLSRPDSIHNLAIGNNTSVLNHMMIIKIRTAASYAKRRLFLNHIQQMAPQTQQRTRDLITQLCTFVNIWEGGCMKLLSWFTGLGFSKQI